MSVIAVMLAATVAAAQTPPAQTPVGGKGRKAWKLELKSWKEVPTGKAVFVEGTATKEPEWLFVENLSVMQPVTVTVLTKDATHDVRVRLGKTRWDSEFHKDVSSKGNRQQMIKLRTQGELRIVVTSKDGQAYPYQLIVWAGDEIKPEMPKLVVAKKSFKPGKTVGSSKSGGSGSSKWAIVSIVAVVGILGAVLVSRRRKR